MKNKKMTMKIFAGGMAAFMIFSVIATAIIYLIH